jgi:hypothetical protein
MKRKFRNRGWLAKGWLAKGWLAKGWLAKGWLAKGWLAKGRFAACWLAGGLSLVSVACAAQYRPTVTEKVDSVPKGGFYRIVLPPSFVAECRADLSDLRIYDQNGNEIPYVLKTDVRDPLNAGPLAIPDPRIQQRDSGNRHSYCRLEYDDAYRIERLSLVITQPILYKRTAVISAMDDPGDRVVVATISIDPGDTVFRVPAVKAKRLMIDISNQDNAPLAISRVATAQSGIYLLTLLRPQREYRLVAGDPAVRSPDYDLHYFTDSLGEIPPTLRLGPLRREGPGVEAGGVAGKSGEARRSGVAGRSGVLLWSLVGVILLLLLYVSVKLARAVDQKGKE